LWRPFRAENPKQKSMRSLRPQERGAGAFIERAPDATRSASAEHLSSCVLLDDAFLYEIRRYMSSQKSWLGVMRTAPIASGRQSSHAEIAIDVTRITFAAASGCY
jgi:hypothetical protein